MPTGNSNGLRNGMMSDCEAPAALEATVTFAGAAGFGSSPKPLTTYFQSPI